MGLLDSPLQRGLVVSLAAGVRGYVQPLWFFTHGYALSIAVQAAIDLLLQLHTGQLKLPPFATAHALASLLYGLRLSAFLAWRGNLPSYRNRSGATPMPARPRQLGPLLPMHVSVAVLYGLMYLPSAKAVQLCSGGRNFNFDFNNLRSLSAWGLLGTAYGALLLEAVADQQKCSAKITSPDKPVMTGAFRLCRHPNYLGEVVFWLALWGATAAAGGYRTWQDWALSTIGVAGITQVMVHAVSGLEKKQRERYTGPDYQRYRSEVRWPPSAAMADVD